MSPERDSVLLELEPTPGFGALLMILIVIGLYIAFALTVLIVDRRREKDSFKVATELASTWLVEFHAEGTSLRRAGLLILKLVQDNEGNRPFADFDESRLAQLLEGVDEQEKKIAPYACRGK